MLCKPFCMVMVMHAKKNSMLSDSETADAIRGIGKSSRAKFYCLSF